MKVVRFISGVLVAIVLLVGCASGGETTKATDELAHKFVTAFVEGNDQLYREILSKKDPRYQIAAEGDHPNEGLAKEMGERYLIQRYDDKGTLYYYIEMYHPKNDAFYIAFLKVVKEEGKWKIHIVEREELHTLRTVVTQEKPVIVHEYKE